MFQSVSAFHLRDPSALLRANLSGESGNEGLSPWQAFFKTEGKSQIRLTPFQGAGPLNGLCLSNDGSERCLFSRLHKSGVLLQHLEHCVLFWAVPDQKMVVKQKEFINHRCSSVS